MIVPYWLRTFFFLFCVSLCGWKSLWPLCGSVVNALTDCLASAASRGTFIYFFCCCCCVCIFEMIFFFFRFIPDGAARGVSMGLVALNSIYQTTPSHTHTHTLIMLLSTTLSTSLPLHFFFFVHFFHNLFTIWAETWSAQPTWRSFPSPRLCWNAAGVCQIDFILSKFEIILIFDFGLFFFFFVFQFWLYPNSE